MTILQSLLRHPLRHHVYQRLQQLPRAGLAGDNGTSAIRRNFHGSTRQWIEHSDSQQADVHEKDFEQTLRDYKESYTSPRPDFVFRPLIDLPLDGTWRTAVGFLTKIKAVSSTLAFAQLTGDSDGTAVQFVVRRPELVQQLKSIKLNSPVSITGDLQPKHKPKRKGEASKSAHESEVGDASSASPAEVNSGSKINTRRLANGKIPHKIEISMIEINTIKLQCLNSFPANFTANANHVYQPQDRHFQIRYDEELKRRLLLRSEVASLLRSYFVSRKFYEIETPVLFKSTPEGAREFLVPTRKPGLAYALPQSPQQYKQILMASGIHKYFQFARCFRDEDLRADRQPEFTQIDLEMAFEDGKGVMHSVERLIKDLYGNLAKDANNRTSRLPSGAFLRMKYAEAMGKHGSDKPDLRIPHLIYRVEKIISPELRKMLTSIEKPTIEVCKIRLNGSSKEVKALIRKFMDSPEAEVFSKNPDGPPGLCIVDPAKPLGGLQIFGFEGAEAVTDFINKLSQPRYHSAEEHAVNTSLEEGDLVLLQAREPGIKGGSTVLGKLRTAIWKAALAEGLVEPSTEHKYLWVTDFPMFTLDDGVDPGQGGTAGFSATHHPFTAPKTLEDIDLLMTDPLKAKADHYDLVVNGVELGGGSRRIHSAEMQKFVMRDILKMSEERMNDFSHLFDALSAGCPPHAGLAIGFDRLMAVLTGRESVKDVIAFPKSSKGEDMMVKSPSRMTDRDLKTYHLRLDLPSSRQAASQAVEEDIETTPEEVVEEIKSEKPSQVGSLRVGSEVRETKSEKPSQAKQGWGVRFRN